MKQDIEINFGKLYDLAHQSGQVDSLEHNIFTLYTLYRMSFQIRRLLLSTRLSSTEKIGILRELPCFQSSSVFESLTQLIIDNDMVNRLYYIRDGFSTVVSAKLNRVIVQIFSAVPLSDTMLQEIKQKLAPVIGKGVMLQSSVNPALLGGLIIKLPDGKIWNFTYGQALSNLRHSIIQKG